MKIKLVALSLLLSCSLAACANEAPETRAENKAMTHELPAGKIVQEASMPMQATIVAPQETVEALPPEAATTQPVIIPDIIAEETPAEMLPLIDLNAGMIDQISNLEQGGLVFARTRPGAHVDLDGKTVRVDANGFFMLGFGRDHGASATLTVTDSAGETETQKLVIKDRHFPVQRIDNLDPSKVNQYSEAQLKVIRASTAKKKTARQLGSTDEALWSSGFMWPCKGPISGVFGAQRILNGVKKRPHSGTDVAAPTGTPILAPADGIITLAEHGMYFEGGLIFIDHGQELESAMMHLSKIDVKTGDVVRKGDKIGEVGATGRVTGPHLHWSLKWKKSLVDAKLVMGHLPN